MGVEKTPTDNVVVPSVCEVASLGCFDLRELKRWQIRTRKVFSLSNRCNDIVDPLSLPHTSLQVPFVHTDCAGHHVWLEPPHNKLWPVLSHYNACKKKNPEGTSACALVPEWQGGSAWRKELLGWRLLHVYPVGTAISKTKTSDVPLQLWYDPPVTSPPPAGWPGIECAAWRPQDSDKRVRTKAPEKLAMCGQSLKMTFSALLGNRPAKILIDSGASASFMSHAFAAQLSAPTQKVVCPPVAVVGGGTTPVLGRCAPRLSLQQHVSSPSFLLLETLPCGYDAVLGEDWMDMHKAQLHVHGPGLCTVRKGWQRITLMTDEALLTDTSSPVREVEIKHYAPPPMLSAFQFVRAARKAEKVFMVQVQPPEESVVVEPHTFPAEVPGII